MSVVLNRYIPHTKYTLYDINRGIIIYQQYDFNKYFKLLIPNIPWGNSIPNDCYICKKYVYCVMYNNQYDFILCCFDCVRAVVNVLNSANFNSITILSPDVCVIHNNITNYINALSFNDISSITHPTRRRKRGLNYNKQLIYKNLLQKYAILREVLICDISLYIMKLIVL
jgi:hypothetical protein